MKKQLANMLTGCRILGCGALLLVPVFSVPFYIVYALCGLSDMLDGTVARKTGGVSRLGARLDSAADLLLTAVVLGRLLLVLSVPGWLWVWVAVTAALRLLNILCGFLCQKTLVMLHTTLNKLTGLLAFLLPLTLRFVPLRYSAPVVCAVATLAAIQEGHYIRAGHETIYNC